MEFFSQQKIVIDEAPLRPRFGCWYGTGSGKTRTYVAVAEGTTLVICPKTQADERIWELEWALQGKEGRLVVLSKERFKKLFKEAPDSICGYLGPDTIIIDEAHTVAGVQPTTRQKNYVKFPKTSQIYQAVQDYVDLYQPKRVHPLTATPCPNPMAVYALARIMGYDWDYFKFRETFYFEKSMRGRTIWMVNRSKANKELMSRTLASIGYVGRLQDWFDVPEQTFHEHHVGVTREQERAYQELRLLYPDPVVLAGKRQKIEQGVFEGRMVKENKSDAIAYYLDQFGKVVVFCRYTDQIEHYRKVFEKRCEVITLTGATKDRKEAIERANAAEECLFVAQCQISAGWELPDFPCMVFASVNYSFVDFDQAKGRILRANNLKKNLYVHLIAGDGDDRAMKVVSDKQDFSEAMYAKELTSQNSLRTYGSR